VQEGARTEVERKCTGECCRRFHLYIEKGIPATLEQVKAADHHPENLALIPLLRRINQSRYFRCTAWDPETRLCTIYERRPKLCREFPYRDPCPHCGLEPETPQE
jgi:Fe-S-cluster containining protein